MLKQVSLMAPWRGKFLYSLAEDGSFFILSCVWQSFGRT